MDNKLGSEIDLSGHCLVDHRQALGSGLAESPLTARTVLWRLMLRVDRQARFVGLRGGTWRILGVDHSEKNPNLCNV